VLNDSYNASPTSMKSALETLAGYPGAARRIAFLGDMKELGDHSASLHNEVADFALSLGLDSLYTVGTAMSEALPHADGQFATSEEAARFAGSDLAFGAGDVILAKGSRAMAMELVAEALRKR
jgi:UDP-N-acetylmuramoyl-tripeptide--D-alanyl-D-alanine ligase